MGRKFVLHIFFAFYYATIVQRKTNPHAKLVHENFNTNPFVSKKSPNFHLSFKEKAENFR